MTANKLIIIIVYDGDWWIDLFCSVVQGLLVEMERKMVVADM